jgi:hypothetical protein
LDNIVTRSTELDKELAEELFNCSKEIPNIPTLMGHTMCTYDFYEGETNVYPMKATEKCQQLFVFKPIISIKNSTLEINSCGLKSNIKSLLTY